MTITQQDNLPTTTTESSSSYSSKPETGDGLSWDDLCMNPFDRSVEKGREEGAEAGMEAGYNEGYYLGKMKGIEIGFELGFIRGFVTVVRNQIIPTMIEGQQTEEPATITPARIERIQKRLDDLENALKEFPSSEELFSNPQNSKITITNTMDGDSMEDKAVGLLEGDQTALEEDESSISAIDVTAQLQSVRSKFKLLTVLLKMPHLNLKNFLRDNTTETLQSIPETHNNDKQHEGDTRGSSEFQSASEPVGTNSLSASSDW
mmetsp:Transcript_4279/g.6509  ORF Transcript_4279/g.6509 Transcript_4279/m.6509 type:complete len:262 (-) Transcript_4279:85-870(-)